MTSLGVLGRPALIAAMVFAIAAFALCLTGAIRRRSDLSKAGLRAVFATTAFTAIGVLALVGALVAHDFSFSYVATHSSRSLSGIYLLPALWSGMEGSLLFWALL